MEDEYYICLRPHTDESHRIHKADCPFNPTREKRIYLGTFSSPEGAVKAGGKYFQNRCRCRFCLPLTEEEKSILSANTFLESLRLITSKTILPSMECGLFCALN